MRTEQKSEKRTARTHVFALGLLGAAAICGTAHAESKTFTSSGIVLQAAWTNCPANPASTTVCTYTVSYASQGTNFDRFLIVNVGYIRVQPGGAAEVLASATGYQQPAANVSAVQDTLGTGIAAGSFAVGENCTDFRVLSTCQYTYPIKLYAQWTATGGVTKGREAGSLAYASGIKYAVRNDADARPATAKGTLIFNGSAWPLGASVGASISRYAIKQALKCPSDCPEDATARAGVNTSMNIQSAKPALGPSAVAYYTDALRRGKVTAPQSSNTTLLNLNNVGGKQLLSPDTAVTDTLSNKPQLSANPGGGKH